jgi:NAD(P)H-dependent FMN reductase
MSTKILVLLGSLRQSSFNRRIAELATTLGSEDVTIELFDGLREVPFYDQDIDGDTPPAAAVALRDAANAADGLLLISPTYNGGVPAHLKNAVDWLSRPYGAAALSGTPVAAGGTAYGPTGGSFAHDSLLTSIEIAGGHPVNEVKFAIPGSEERFAALDPQDDPEVREQLQASLDSLVAAVREKDEVKAAA